MIAVCQQPHYLPWLGYFELFARADAFVFLDTVQWTRQGRQHRTRLLRDGKPFWLSVPVVGHGHREKALKDMKVADLPWTERHRAKLEAAYGKAPFFETQVKPLLWPYFEKVQKEKFLVDVCQEGLWLFWDHFGLQSELHWSSDFPGAGDLGEKNERLIELCQRLGADTYYSSLGSTRYLDLSVFRENGLQVRWQHFRRTFPGDIHRPQDLSVLDWLAHHEWHTLKDALRPPAPFPIQSQEAER